VCEQVQFAVPHNRTVLTLSVNKIDPGTLMAVVQDITRAIELESRVREDQQRFSAIFDNVRDYAIYTADLNGRLDTWNQSLSRIGGWERSDVIGTKIGICFPKDLAAQQESLSLLDRARRFGTAEFEGWAVRRDGSLYWANTVATALPDEDGEPAGFFLVTRDLTERKQMEDRLLALSNTDPLTGAFNRRAGDARLLEAALYWRSHGQVFSALMLDCDHFKAINDRWGHDTGDVVLIALVGICQQHLRATDAIFRWGGEEFLVLLPGISGAIAVTVAERLRLALEAAEISSHAIKVTLSIGVAEIRDGEATANDLLHRADQALYAAKNGGRNQVRADLQLHDGMRAGQQTGAPSGSAPVR
jgi:diguanylate cyclase (GGDEF)-like protein/PAS domain S-box-containing protein